MKLICSPLVLVKVALFFVLVGIVVGILLGGQLNLQP
jgi:hypothetical protein